MTYASGLITDNVSSGYLVVLKPRRVVSSWTVVSGNVYKKSFTYGFVTLLESNGVALTAAGSNSPTSGQFYWEESTSFIYVNINANPSTKTLVATYEILSASNDLHWYRSPLDSGSTLSFWEGTLSGKPRIKASMRDLLAGHTPAQSSQITFNDRDFTFLNHVYDSSFNQAQIKIYTWFGDLTVANCKLAYTGTIGAATHSGLQFTLTMRDRIDIFNKAIDGLFYNPSTINLNTFYDGIGMGGTITLAIDPNYIGKPISIFYGRVSGVKGVNVQYDATEGSTQNRYFAFSATKTSRDAASNSYALVKDLTVDSALLGSNTVTRTYLTTVQGVSVGDRVWLNINAKTTGAVPTRHAAQNFYVTVTARGADYIDHTTTGGAPIQFSGTDANSSEAPHCYVCTFPVVDIIQNGVRYKAFYGRDYSTFGLDSTSNTEVVSGIYFDASAETNMSIPEPIGPSDVVTGTVYGRDTLPTISASDFGGLNSATQTNQGIVSVLYDVLREFMGLTEAEIDTSTFQAIEFSFDDQIALRAPASVNNEFPSASELLNQILLTGLFRFFLNDDGLWSLNLIQPLPSSTRTANSESIAESGAEFSFSYDEVFSDIVVEYKEEEIPSTTIDTEPRGTRIYLTNSLAKYLHKKSEQKTFKTFHYDDTEAASFAARLGYIFSERKAIATMRVEKSFYNSEIGETVTVTRDKMPGNVYDGETEFSQNFALIETDKTNQAVEIVLDDQKGIEDNSGSW